METGHKMVTEWAFISFTRSPKDSASCVSTMSLPILQVHKNTAGENNSSVELRANKGHLNFHPRRGHWCDFWWKTPAECLILLRKLNMSPQEGAERPSSSYFLQSGVNQPLKYEGAAKHVKRRTETNEMLWCGAGWLRSTARPENSF